MIERRSALSREEFFRDYFHANRPVILQGLLDDWPAYRLWSPEYLKSTCGDAQVEIMAGRDADPNFEINCERHRATISFGDYVDCVVDGSGNDSYLVANNRFLETGPGQKLLRDIVPFPEYLDGGDLRCRAFFWLGPAGTITPLHHDTMSLFLAQVVGHKRIAFISPDQTQHMYNRVGVFSDVDYERPDLARFPLFGHVVAEDFILNPGEVLFIPVGWWHHVRSLTASISVSFTNFLA